LCIAEQKTQDIAFLIFDPVKYPNAVLAVFHLGIAILVRISGPQALSMCRCMVKTIMGKPSREDHREKSILDSEL
jgi:hypothetical protein